MSGVGGSTGGGGGSGSGGGDGVAQELAEVRAKIEKLEKAIDVQQEKLEDAEGNDVRWGLIATALAAKEQRLDKLEGQKLTLLQQQQLQLQQQTQAGECPPSVWCFVCAPMYSVCSRRRLLCVAGGAVICVVRSDVWRRRWRHERVEMT